MASCFKKIGQNQTNVSRETFVFFMYKKNTPQKQAGGIFNPRN